LDPCTPAVYPGAAPEGEDLAPLETVLTVLVAVLKEASDAAF